VDYATGLQSAGAVAEIAEISIIDLMLSADNALLIAMCCNSLPPSQVRKAVVLGTAGAILLRCMLTVFAGLLMQIPYLKILAAAALAAIAIKLIVANDRKDIRAENAIKSNSENGAVGEAGGYVNRVAWSAVATFVAADFFMSLDNIVALAAVAQGNAVLLIFGLLLSIPLLVFGGLLVVGLLRRHPIVVELGGVMLGWIAGQIALADPAIAGWVQREAPALPIVLPLLGAILVFWESRIIRRAGRRAKSLLVMSSAVAMTPPNARTTAMPTRATATGRSE
jgi:YjbE family integral membrane protein